MNITVKVAELLNMINELKKDNIEYVELEILEEQEFEGERIPAILHFSAYDGEGGGIDYNGVEEVKISATYKLD